MTAQIVDSALSSVRHVLILLALRALPPAVYLCLTRRTGASGKLAAVAATVRSCSSCVSSTP